MLGDRAPLSLSVLHSSRVPGRSLAPACRSGRGGSRLERAVTTLALSLASARSGSVALGGSGSSLPGFRAVSLARAAGVASGSVPRALSPVRGSFRLPPALASARAVGGGRSGIVDVVGFDRVELAGLLAVEEIAHFIEHVEVTTTPAGLIQDDSFARVELL